MVILVCGSREWSDAERIRGRFVWLPNNARIIHGAARGADRIAATVASELGIPVQAFPADWSVKPHTPVTRIRQRRDGSLYDAAAGIERNLAMLDALPELVLAFQVNGSRGTQHTIDEARKRGIPVEVNTPW